MTYYPHQFAVSPPRLETVEELPEAAQDLSRQLLEPFSPHACKLLALAYALKDGTRPTALQRFHRITNTAGDCRVPRESSESISMRLGNNNVTHFLLFDKWGKP